MGRASPLLLLTFPVLLLPACSLRSLALESTRETLRAMELQFRSESSYRFAREAGPGLLKTLEGVAATAPEDPEVQAMACRFHAQFALAFLGDDPEYAGRLYSLAEGYGRAALAVAGDGEPPLDVRFWLAAALAGRAGTSLEPARRLALARESLELLQGVLAEDPAFQHGAGWLLLARLHGELPAWLGGGRAAALRDLEAARRHSGDRLLLARVEEARLVAAQGGGDVEAARRLLDSVLAAPTDILPGDELLTAVAREEARRLLEALPAD